MPGKYRFLVAPLNWGLGHAGRCVPIINTLLEAGQDVVLASSGVALDLIRLEFPELPYYQLPDYGIRYPKEGLIPSLARQSARVLWMIQKERQFLVEIVSEARIDAVISDNRYGLSLPEIPCVFIAHQIHLRGNTRAGSQFANWIQSRFVKKFQMLWVPDFPEPENLAGEMSAPPYPIPTKHLGVLSRLERIDISTPEFKSLLILSGPEPLRSFLEQKMKAQLKKAPGRHLLIQGLPSPDRKDWREQNVDIVNRLHGPDLSRAIGNAEVIICRAGYTTLMDLYSMGGKKALLIPTKGQTEQEYLAKQMELRGWCACQTQDNFELAQGIQKAIQSKGFPIEESSQRHALMRKTVIEFIEELKEK